MGVFEKIKKYVGDATPSYTLISAEEGNDCVSQRINLIKSTNCTGFYQDPEQYALSLYANCIDQNGEMPIYHFLAYEKFDLKKAYDLVKLMDPKYLNATVYGKDPNGSILNFMANNFDLNKIQTKEDANSFNELLNLMLDKNALVLTDDMCSKKENINKENIALTKTNTMEALSNKACTEVCNNHKTFPMTAILENLCDKGYFPNNSQLDQLKLDNSDVYKNVVTSKLDYTKSELENTKNDYNRIFNDLRQLEADELKVVTLDIDPATLFSLGASARSLRESLKGDLLEASNKCVMDAILLNDLERKLGKNTNKLDIPTSNSSDKKVENNGADNSVESKNNTDKMFEGNDDSFTK